MSIRIYYTSFEQLPYEKFKSLLVILPEDIQNRILKYRRWQDACAGLLGKHLLLKGLSDYKLNKSLDQLNYIETGRPYIDHQLDFNITHSGNVVACAMSTTCKLGIDIELVAPIDISNFKAVFAEDEWLDIINASNSLTQFYHYWTLKESILKADGNGLSELTSIQLLNKRQAVFRSKTWNFVKLFIEKDYVCHISFESSTSLIEIEKITF